MKMEQTKCSETSAYKIQMPGNYPEEIIQPTEHGESFKSRLLYPVPLKRTFLLDFIAGQFSNNRLYYAWGTEMLTHNSGRVTQICVFNTVNLGTSASSPQCHSTRGNVSRGITPSSTTRVFGEYFLKISVHKNS